MKFLRSVWLRAASFGAAGFGANFLGQLCSKCSPFGIIAFDHGVMLYQNLIVFLHYSLYCDGWLVRAGDDTRRAKFCCDAII